MPLSMKACKIGGGGKIGEKTCEKEERRGEKGGDRKMGKKKMEEAAKEG
jgi:hypothetical protein